MVRSSAYCSVVALFSLSGCGLSLIYILNRIGDMADPCGTPAVEVKGLEFLFLC